MSVRSVFPAFLAPGMLRIVRSDSPMRQQQQHTQHERQNVVVVVVEVEHAATASAANERALRQARQ